MYTICWPDIYHICKHRSMCIIQSIIALNYHQNLQPVGFFSWNALMEWLSTAECTYNKPFGEEIWGFTQLMHQSSQALSSSLLTLLFRNTQIQTIVGWRKAYCAQLFHSLYNSYSYHLPFSYHLSEKLMAPILQGVLIALNRWVWGLSRKEKKTCEYDNINRCSGGLLLSRYCFPCC